MTIRLFPSEQVWDSQYPYLPGRDQHLVYPNVYREYEERTKTSPTPLGSFVPGVFRIQPYSVMRRTFIGTRSRCASISNLGSANETRRQYYGKHCCTSYVSQMCRSTSLPDLSAQRMLALQRAYGKIGQPDLQLGPELGELRETISMLRSPLRALRDFLEHPSNFKKLERLDSLRKFRNTRGSSVLLPTKVAADTWLEFRMGLKPFVNAVTAVMKYLLEARTRMLNKDRILSVRSRWGDTSAKILSGGERINYVWVDHSYDVRDDFRVEGIVYFKWLYEQPGTAKLGLDPVNIPEVFWELTRLSFVVDWLFSVGPWLESFRFTPHIEILGSTTSQKISRHVKVRGVCVQQDVTERDAGTATYTEESFSRFTHTSQPLTPIFRGGSGLDLGKLIDSAALILQPLLKKLKK